jgi:hypothetical protein
MQHHSLAGRKAMPGENFVPIINLYSKFNISREASKTEQYSSYNM